MTLLSVYNSYKAVLSAIPQSSFSQDESFSLLTDFHAALSHLITDLSALDLSIPNNPPRRPPSKDVIGNFAMDLLCMLPKIKRNTTIERLKKASHVVVDPLVLAGKREYLYVNPSQKTMKLPSKTTYFFFAFCNNIPLTNIGTLGSGNFGFVMQATIGKTIFACKQIIQKKNQSEDHRKYQLESFHREAFTYLTLNHLNILKCFIFTQFDSKPSIYLELATHGTLEKFILTQTKLPKKFRIIPEQLRLKLFRELTDALSYLHEKRIAHLDIKTNNIMLSDSLSAKLGDFGMARSTTTKNNILCIEYAAPESIYRHSFCASATDVWALAIVVYETFKTHRPHIAPEKVTRDDYRMWLYQNFYNTPACQEKLFNPKEDSAEWDQYDPNSTFRTLLLHCLDGNAKTRWSANQALNHLSNDIK